MSINPVKKPEFTQIMPILTSIAGFVPKEAAVINKKFAAARISSLMIVDFKKIVEYSRSNSFLASFAKHAIDSIKPLADVKNADKMKIVEKFKEIFLNYVGTHFTSLSISGQTQTLKRFKTEQFVTYFKERASYSDAESITYTLALNNHLLLIDFFTKKATQTTPTEYIIKGNQGTPNEWEIKIPRTIVNRESTKSILESGIALRQEIQQIKQDPQNYDRFQDWLSLVIDYRENLPHEIIVVCLEAFDFSEDNQAYETIQKQCNPNGIRRFSELTAGLLHHLNRFQLTEEMTEPSTGAGTVHPIAFRGFYAAFIRKYPQAIAAPKNPAQLVQFFRSPLVAEDLPDPEDVDVNNDPKPAIAVIEHALDPETDPSYLETIFSGEFPISDEFLKIAIQKACETDDAKLANTILFANIKNRRISDGILVEFARKAVLRNAHQVFDVILKREKNIDLTEAALKALGDNKNRFIKRIVQHLEKQMNNPEQSYADFQVIGKLASAVVRNRLGIDTLNSAMAVMKTIAKVKNKSLEQLGAKEFFNAAAALATPKEYFYRIFDGKFFNEPWGDSANPPIEKLWNSPSLLDENKRRIHQIFQSGTMMSSEEIVKLLTISHLSGSYLCHFVLPRIRLEVLCEIDEKIQTYEPDPALDAATVQTERQSQLALLLLIQTTIAQKKQQQQSSLGKRPADPEPQLEGPPHLRRRTDS